MHEQTSVMLLIMIVTLPEKLGNRKRRCPLCRQKIDSTVPNRPLKQILTKIANNFSKNGSTNVTIDRDSVEQSVFESDNISQTNQDVAESLNLRKIVLQQELDSIEKQKKNAEEMIAKCQKNVQQMKRKELNTREQIMQLQETMQKITMRIDNENNQLQKHYNHKKKLINERQLVQSVLIDVEEKLDKCQFFT